MAHVQNKYGAAHSTDAYNGQGEGRNKGLKEKITENIPGVGNKDHRNNTSSATTDAYGNVIRKDEYGNVIPTDEYGNPIRHNGTTHQDGQGGRRNKGLKEKIMEKIPGVGNKNHRNNTSSATTTTHTMQKLGVMEKIKQMLPGHRTASHDQHTTKKGVIQKIKEKIPGQRTTTTHNQHNQHY